MELLKRKILEVGRVEGEGILKVDSFLNHQLDIVLLNEIGREFYRLFKDYEITKILTAEVSGIAIATIAAQYFNVPVVFAKKTLSKNLDRETYEGEVYSYTKDVTYKIRVSKRYLCEEDKLLIIDDFLANGEAVLGLKQIIDSANASLLGVGIVIEKGFQKGGKVLREKGIEVKSLAIVDDMKNGKINFR
ncbi:xanthine phosphoribosyltransferase [Alkaliphilus peptidifermentans]|uniref:Xanthine phosphoribosyltransferase n=1 Tax=Alkaliphilus peptidifermentans DSM 18978 TaxID=1120976 RepID=A0A1G5LDS5_9FIRM|nr:xanthine phosphoribosyltransferase [Alkaliphilus peptidifermentans]SCZ10448.1 xanthine phosphoribosyltransferase [Alkaliphilus peptidifermentans DSM 18978]